MVLGTRTFEAFVGATNAPWIVSLYSRKATLKGVPTEGQPISMKRSVLSILERSLTSAVVVVVVMIVWSASSSIVAGVVSKGSTTVPAARVSIKLRWEILAFIRPVLLRLKRPRPRARNILLKPGMPVIAWFAGVITRFGSIPRVVSWYLRGG